MYKPTLHKEVPIGTRVYIPSMYYSYKDKRYTGTVAGIASMHVVFGYIVILDEEIPSEFGDLKAIVVYGSQLEGLNGEHWRLV